MKPAHHLTTLLALLALTGMTAVFALSKHAIVAALALAMAKILLVAFRFMDLRHAHIFWKCIIVVLTGGSLTAIGLLAAA
ncbi:MAG: hypothetical protein EOP50_07310 [Sphingobacteriales bacterium]|nr:MAG: hypothetical protein EOP50_07310 [Sphingobacteriales bacterium]